MDVEQREERRKSTELSPMDVDKTVDLEDDESFNDDDRRESVVTNVLVSSRGQNKNMPKAYLTKEEFDYTMNLFNTKITALYQLVRHVSNQQQEDTKSLKRLVALDELSDDFWTVSYSF